MEKNQLIKRISLLTASILIITSLSALSNLADANDDNTTQTVGLLEDVLATEQVDGIDTDVELGEHVLSDDFDLEEEVANITSIQSMDEEQNELFYQLVKEQVAISGLENEEEQELFEESLINFFDETFDTYGDLEAAQDELETELNEIVEEEQNSFLLKR